MSRVLLIDDDDDRRQLVRLWLLTAGYEVSTSRLPDDVVALAASQRPDVTLVAASNGSAPRILDALATASPTARILLSSSQADLDAWSGPSIPASASGAAILAALGSVVPAVPARAAGTTDPSAIQGSPSTTEHAAAAPAAPAAPASRPSVQGPAKGRILVVDDEADLRELLVKQLNLLGYEASGAPDGATALRMARRETTDAVLLDLDMPGIHGHDVLRILRSDPSTTSLPVVLLTARAQGADVALGLSAGADDYVRKPFSLTEVGARLEAAIARSRTIDLLVDLRDVLVPETPRRRAFLDPAVAYQPSAGAMAGGDVHAVRPGPAGTTFAVVGDVGGHGPRVAAMAAHLRAVVSNHAATSKDPAALLSAVNASVLATGDGPDGSPSMATMVCVQFDPSAGLVTCATAGHMAPLVIPGGREIEVDAGVPLGVLDDPAFPMTVVSVPSKAALMLYTDGLSEARRDGRGEMLGERALASTVAALPGPGTGGRGSAAWASSLVEEVMAAHAHWTGGVGADDVTVLVLALTDDWVSDPQVHASHLVDEVFG